MARKSKRAKLHLDSISFAELKHVAQSQTKPLRVVQRAKILLHYYSGESITKIQQVVGLCRKATYKWIDIALACGIEAGIQDQYHTQKLPVITPEAKDWVINVARTKPKELGYAAEIWSPQKLAEHTRRS